MGQWQENSWQWNFLWRRNLFAWKQELLQDLLHLISQYCFVEGLEDQVMWKFDTDGNFSVKSFFLQVVRDAASSLGIHSQSRLVWKKLAPPRVELLVWFIMMECLSTKDRLTRFNCTFVTDQTCVLCRVDNESMEHLFFSCQMAWLLWYNSLKWWGI